MRDVDDDDHDEEVADVVRNDANANVNVKDVNEK